MTRSLTNAPTTRARKVAQGEDVPPAACACGRSLRRREHWSFTGRETHWGYAFLIWTRDDGKRYARFVG